MNALRKQPDRAADIRLITGQSGSGKSFYVKSCTDSSKRVLVWDVKGEYRGFQRIEGDRLALVRALKGAGAGRFAYVPRHLADFDFWCQAAYAWGHCDVIAEELADVTTPGKAPPGWGVILRRGRERVLRVFGVTQRPAESDKTIMGNWTLARCFSLRREGDRAYMARELGVSQGMLDSLQLDRHEWIERATHPERLTRGGEGMGARRIAQKCVERDE
jgi:hypothetical protein